MNETTTAPTRRDLAMRGLDALDPAKAGATVVSQSAGGVTFATAMEVMEFAKLMAVSDTGVPKHLRANPGTCMRIVFQAIEWRMSPFAVADKSYVVNDRLAYESQLIHAVIESRGPLQKRLDCHYDGEGPTRTCTVVGEFTDGEVRDYTTPQIKDIKVKNSPLWTADPDQQLFYYASRSWARKWCPDVLLGIYSKEELRENPELGRDDRDEDSGVRARLATHGHGENEGAGPGHVERELAQVVGDGTKTIIIEGKAEDAPKTGQESQPGEAAEAGSTKADPKGGKKAKRASEAPKGNAGHTAKVAKDGPSQTEVSRVADRAAAPPAKQAMPKLPKNAAEYIAYAESWIKTSTDAKAMNQRWADERTLRNNCQITLDDRGPLDDLLVERREQLS